MSVWLQSDLAQGSTLPRSLLRFTSPSWLCTNFLTFQGKSLCLRNKRADNASLREHPVENSRCRGSKLLDPWLTFVGFDAGLFRTISRRFIVCVREIYPSIRGTSVRILLITSSLCWCVTGADCRSNGRQRPPSSRAPTRSKIGANTRHLLRGLSSLRSLLLPLLGESSHGGGSRTVPLHGATSGSSVRHVVWKQRKFLTFITVPNWIEVKIPPPS